MKKAIILTCFGTSYKDAIEKSIYPLKDRLEEEFYEYRVFIAFTSKVIREKLLLKHNMQVFSIEGLLKRLKENKFEEVIIMPLQLMEGRDQKTLEEVCEKYTSSFKCLSLLKPLLTLDKNNKLINEELIIKFFTEISKVHKNIIFVAHGIKNDINIPFKVLQKRIHESGIKNIFIFTMEGSPNFEHVSEQMINKGINEVALLSFLMVSGYHSEKDIFDECGKSYYRRLEGLGFKVNKDKKSLGEREAILKIYVKILRKSID